MSTWGTVKAMGLPSERIATRPSKSFAATTSGFSKVPTCGKSEEGSSSKNLVKYELSITPSIRTWARRFVTRSTVFFAATSDRKQISTLEEVYLPTVISRITSDLFLRRRRKRAAFTVTSSVKPSRGPLITLLVGGSSTERRSHFFAEKRKISFSPSTTRAVCPSAMAFSASATDETFLTGAERYT